MKRLHTNSLFASFRPNHFYMSISLCGALLLGTPELLHAQALTFTGTSPSVNFGNVNLCAAGKTTPAPCSETLSLNYKVTATGTLGTTKVVTGGKPDLDFTMASGSTCTGEVTAGASCVVNVDFKPRFAGTRSGAVQITDKSGKVLTTTFIYGFGTGPQLGFDPGTLVYVPFELTPTALGFPPGPNYYDFFTPNAVAVDGAGDIFLSIGASISSDAYTVVAELPADGSPQKVVFSLPKNIFSYLVVDGAGNLFITAFHTDFSTEAVVIELPEGGGAPIVLPFAPNENAPFVATDASGNVYTANGTVERLSPGSDAPVTVSGLVPSYTIEVDGSGNIFTTDSASIDLLELPAGGGAEKTLWSAGLGIFALDNIGNAYIDRSPIDEFPAGGGPLISIHNIGGGPNTVGPAGDFYGINCCYGIAEARRSVPPTLNFGVIPVGSTVSLPQIVTNTGTGNLAATATIDNAAYRIKSVTPANCLAAIGPSEKCQLEVEFSPATVGTQPGVLQLETNAVNEPIAAISLQGGSSLPPPILSLTPGVYASAQTVSISDAVGEAAIYYTTNGSIPTSSSARYQAPITVGSTERLTAIAVVAGSASTIATADYTIATAPPAQSINLSTGFTANSVQFNGNATLDGSRLQLTSAQGPYQTVLENQAGSAFYTTPVNIQAFTTNFIFQLTDPDADGITFTIQNASPKALGAYGKSLGYASIARSVALKFDLHNNAGEGSNSTGLYVDGALPTVPSIDLTGTGINLHNGESYLAQVTYDGSKLTLTLTDTISLATWSHTFAIDIPETVGGDTAYMGFTGGAAAEAAQQEILSWTYISGTPGSTAAALANPPVLPSLPTYPNGFDGPGMIFNGSASHPGTAVQLTDYAKFEAGSAFYAKPVNVQAFTTDFTFQPGEYGMTFTIQNEGLSALGNDGDSLGYAPIGKSVAIKISVYSDVPPGDFTTGIVTDGALPTSSNIDLTYTALNPTVPLSAHIIYDGALLTLTLTDYGNGPGLNIWSQSFPIDIPSAIGGNTAYVGFTGSTGPHTGVQQVTNWTFTNP